MKLKEIWNILSKIYKWPVLNQTALKTIFLVTAMNVIVLFFYWHFPRRLDLNNLPSYCAWFYHF